MEPIEIPKAAQLSRPDCRPVAMGPPRGVSDDDCGTAQMLVSGFGESIPGYPACRNYVYYRPSETELEELRNGGFIEFCQYGNVVQPFSAAVWPAPTEGGNRVAR